MKKLMIISSIIFGFALQASAQIPESRYIVGGSSSFFLSSNPNTGKLASAYFGIRPEVGKFVSDKWFIGGSLGYSISQSRNDYSYVNTEVVSQSVSGKFAATRYYPLLDKLYFTLQYFAGLNYTFGNIESTMGLIITEGSLSSISPGIGISPGLAYFINDKWMIFSQVGSLYYNFEYDLESELGSHSGGYSLNANSFTIGARFILGAKK